VASGSPGILRVGGSGVHFGRSGLSGVVFIGTGVGTVPAGWYGVGVGFTLKKVEPSSPGITNPRNSSTLSNELKRAAARTRNKMNSGTIGITRQKLAFFHLGSVEARANSRKIRNASSKTDTITPGFTGRESNRGIMQLFSRIPGPVTSQAFLHLSLRPSHPARERPGDKAPQGSPAGTAPLRSGSEVLSRKAGSP
jgi:hypothetical protein